MKASKTFLPALLVAGSFLAVFSGCYTQVVTDDEDQGYSSRSRDFNDDQDSTYQGYSRDYDEEDYYRPRYSVGFRYYYPMWSSVWVHYDPWFYDPWYYDSYYYNPYYSPWWCGSPTLVYHFPPYRSYYGWNYPYNYYYRSYPGYSYPGNVASGGTRNSGNRRTSGGRRDEGSGRTASSGGFNQGVIDSRGGAVRSEGGSRNGNAVQTNRGSSPSYGRTSTVQQPSRGTSARREEGNSRSRGASSRQPVYIPPRGERSSGDGGYRSGGSTRSRESSSPPPSYTPPARTSSPPAQSSTPPQNSGGRSGDGGSRSSGATRSGRN